MADREFSLCTQPGSIYNSSANYLAFIILVLFVYVPFWCPAGQPKRLEQQEEAVEEVELMEDSPVLDERREPDSSDLKSSPAGELLEFSTATTTEDDKGDGERRTSMNSDDLLYEDSLAESKPLPPGSAADDVLLELNSEEQEQFEVIDAAGGQEGQQEAGSTAEDRGGKEGNLAGRGCVFDVSSRWRDFSCLF